MKNGMVLNGNVLWLLNPSAFNHHKGLFNLMADNTFMSALHQIYQNLDTISNVNIVVPKLDENTIKHLENINEKIFLNKIDFYIQDDAFGTTHKSNDAYFLNFLKNLEDNKKLDFKNYDFIVSEYAFDFKDHNTIYYFPYYLMNSELQSGSKEQDDLILDVIENSFGRENIKLLAGELDYSQKLFHELCELFSKSYTTQMKDLIHSVKKGYRVLFYNQDLIYANKELEYIFSDLNYLNSIDNILIPNTSDLDDSTALSILFENSRNDYKKSKTKLTLLDRTDNLDKSILKYQLANLGTKNIKYFTKGRLDTHDLNLFNSTGCDVTEIK